MRTAALSLLIAAVPSLAADKLVVLTAKDIADHVLTAEGALEPELVADPADPAEQVIRLPYDFTREVERAYWDFGLDLNLARYGRFEAELIVDEPKAGSGLTIYFQCPPGWYGAALPAIAPDVGKVWRTFSWARHEMQPEDPGPWSTVTAARVSLWKSAPLKGALLLRRIVAYSDTIALVLPEWMRRQSSPEAESATSITQQVADRLRSVGIGLRDIPDTDLAQGGLEGAKVAVIGYAPELDPSAEAAITDFVDGGGKLIAFYAAPEYVLRLIGINSLEYIRRGEGEARFAGVRFAPGALEGGPESMRQDSWNVDVPRDVRADVRVIANWEWPDGKADEPAIVLSDTGLYMGHVLTDPDPAAKSEFLRAAVAHFAPEVWAESYDSARRNVMRIGPYDTDVALAEAVNASGIPAAADTLVSGTAKLAAADAAADAGRYAEACRLVSEAREPLVRAYAMSQPARKGEFRGVWCHSAFGVTGWTWDQSMARLEECGINAIVPNMLWAGLAYYPSEVLPTYPGLAERGDQIAQCLEAARRHHIKVHVWKVNWNLGQSTPEFTERMRAEGRLQMAPDGSEILWLCPSSDENYQLELDSLLEVARNYDVDGIHFDYIRYPGPEGCYCPQCRAKFEAEVGRKAANWPKDVLDRESDLRTPWLEFRREQISRLVKAVSEGARAIRPGIEISAAVFGYYDSIRDSIGQDWVKWINEGWLDFVCPMDYMESGAQFAQIVEQQAEWVGGKVPLYPGIGAFIITPDQLVHQIQLARKHGQGYMIFNYDTSLAKDYLPLLKLGVTRG